MKNKFSLITLLLLLTFGVFAQAPEKINYQAVARNLSGVPLLNQSISVKYEIRSGSSTGTVVYAETHSLTTNPFGLFTAEVGGGTPTFGTMAGIAWGTTPFYLYVEVDGDPMGVTQLLSVPYALFAKESANGPAGLPGKNSLMNITPEPAGANCSAGGNKVESGLDDNNDGTLQALEVDYTYFVCDGVAGPTGPQGPIGLTGPTGTTGPAGANGVGIDSTINNNNGTFTIYYSNSTSFTTSDLTGPAGANGTTYFAGNGISLLNDTITNLGDNDNDPSNELITLTNLNGNTIEITENGTLHSIDLSSILGSSYTQGTGISIAGNTISAIDTSATNELQTLSISNDTIFLSNGNSIVIPSFSETITSITDNGDGTYNYTDELGLVEVINTLDADADSTNEIQDLSLVGDILTITNNGAATSIDLSIYKELPTTASTGDILQWNGSAWIAAIDAVNDADNDPNNEIELPATAITNQVLTWNGSAWIAQNAASGSDNWGSQTVVTNASLTGNGTAGSPLAVNGILTDNQNLINGGKVGNNQTINIVGGTGTTFSIADGDSSATNEIQVLQFTNPTLSLTNGGGSVNLSGLTGPTYTAGSGINIGGTVISAIDNSITNEIQNLSISGNNLNISGGGTGTSISTNFPTTGDMLFWNGSAWTAQPVASININDADANPTNEIQNLSVSGNNLNISGGGAGTTISTNAPTTGDILYWNGTNWVANPTPPDSDNQNLGNTTSPGSVTVNITGGTSTTFSIDDADANPANELITSFGLNGTLDSLVIKEAGNNHAVPLTSLTPTGKWTESGGNLYPTTLSNKVGIGTTTPTGNLHVYGSSPRLFIQDSQTTSAAYPSIELGNTNAGSFNSQASISIPGSGDDLQIAANNAIRFNTNFTERMVITNTGNIGIRVNPTAVLHLNGSLRLDNLSGTAPAIGSVLTSMDAQGNAEWQPIPAATNYWSPNGADIFNNNAGNVGIGISTPNSRLHVQHNIQNLPVFTVTNETGGGTSSIGGTKGGRISVSSNGTEQKTGLEVKISGTGTGQQNGLFVSADGAATGGFNRGVVSLASNNSIDNIAGAYFANGNLGTNYGLQVYTGGTQANTKYGAYIASSGTGTKYGIFSTGENYNYFNGNVGIGIGNSTPTTALSVYSQSGAGNLSLTSATTGTSNTDGFFISNDGSNELFMVQRENANWYFATNGGTTAMTIAPSANVGIGTTSPSTTLDIANSTLGNTVRALNTLTSGTEKLGIYAYSSGAGAGANVGLRGYASGGSGANYGVQGNAFTTGTTNYGIYGTASGATTNWAGYFAGGDVYIQNKLQVNGSFQLGSTGSTNTKMLMGSVQPLISSLSATVGNNYRTITITGAAVGDYIVITMAGGTASHVVLTSASVTAANTVGLNLFNITGAAVAGGTYTFNYIIYK